MGPTSRTQLRSSAVLEAPATDADVEEKVPNIQPNRFARLKKSYKGVTITVPDEDLEGLDFSYDDFKDAVLNTSYSFERDAIVKGVCVQYEPKGVIVDIGAKASAYLPEAEAALIQPSGSEINDLVALNEEFDFQIISEEDENGQLLVSIRRIQYRSAWDTILQMQTNDSILDAEVVSVNRGGAICLVEGLRAFLPGSHLAGKMATDDLIGQILPLKFLEVNQENNKLVVSNRKAVVETQMANLSRGDLVEGTVQALKPYGAFIEVGGMSGLLHISYDRIEDLEQVLQPGMAVKCMIIDHDKVNGRIALSTKTLEPNPGDMLKNSQLVFDMAEASAEKYHTKMEEERKARESAARDIVLGLGDSLDGLGDDLSDSDSKSSDPLADVSDSLDSLLS